MTDVQESEEKGVFGSIYERYERILESKTSSNILFAILFILMGLAFLGIGITVT